MIRRMTISPARRDAMRHMLIAGLRPTDVARGLELRSTSRAVIRPRKLGEVRP
jgi:hypothetical protein